MRAEDNFLKLLINQYNKIAWFKLRQKETEQKLSDTAKQLENEIKKSKDKDKVIIDYAKTLKENGVPVDVIHKKTGLAIDKIEKL